MDRSNFYFRQLTTEENLDHAFDDVERMEQDRTVDADTWGVWRGLLVTEQAVPDLTVKVSAGVAHDEMGRRIECPSTQSVDLSTYLPATPGNTRKIHIYVKNADIASDPRIDGNGNPLNYRLDEDYQTTITAGTEANPGLPPSIVAGRVLLAEITLAQGQTTILDADIATDWQQDQRQPGGLPWRRGRLVVDDLYFNASDDRLISGPAYITLKAGGTPGTDTGLACSDRDIEDVGKIVMTDSASGGFGIDMVDRSIVNAYFVGCLPGGTPGTNIGFDCNDRDIRDAGQLVMTSAGSSGLGIDMQDTDISSLETLKFKASATGVGGLTDPLPVTVSLDLTAKDIIKATQVQAETPDPGSGKGFLYANPADGVLRDVTKYLSYSAGQMLPGVDTDASRTDPWVVTPNANSWYLSETAKGAPLVLAGDISWRMPFSAGALFDSTGLYIPLVGLPEGAKLINFRVGYTIDGAGMNANQYLRLWLMRRNQTSVDILGSNPPANERNGAVGNYTFQEPFTVGASQIVDNLFYSYYVFVQQYAPNLIGGPHDVIAIKFGRLEFQIREASGVY